MALDSAASSCAHIETLHELVAALKDPSQPLIIDLGGRSFTPTGPAVWPRAAPVVLKRSKSDLCPPIPNGHVALDSPPSGRLACRSDSRYADDWCMEEEASFSSSSAASVNADSSPSIDSEEGARILRQQDLLRRRRAPRIAPQAQRVRTRWGQRRRSDSQQAAATAGNATATGDPASWRSQASSDAHGSEDTGDDARVATTPDSHAQAQELRGEHVRIAGMGADSDVAAQQNVTAEEWPADAEYYDIAPDRQARGNHEAFREGRHVAQNDRQPCTNSHDLPGDSSSLDHFDEDCQRPVPDVPHLDIVRPGTVLCNGSIEIPEGMSIRLLASCTLRNLSLRGPGVPAEPYWGYMFPALVLAGWPNTPRILVKAEHVKIKRVGQSNGFKVYGAADVHLTRCTFSNSQRNALIAQGPDSRIFMKHCTLSNNEASGLWIVAGAKVTAESCDFQDNRCNGAALWDVHSTIACRSCTFRRNCTNGLRILYGASASLLACTVAFNQDQGVEAGEAATRVRIEDSTLTCNGNFALKAYQRANVFLKNTIINRGQARALSIHAQGMETHVQTHCCQIDGEVSCISRAVHTQYPPPQQQNGTA